MAKPTSHYVCQSCGAFSPKWSGRCEACGGWNSFVEEAASTGPSKSLAGKTPSKRGRTLELVDLQGTSEKLPRRISGIHEFDRVCGGGLVAGSAILVGGDPGIGKSTLLLQAMAKLAVHYRCAYISGEESIDQIRLRAERLDLLQAPLQLAASNNVREIVETLKGQNAPDILVIDSIQTMFTDVLDSAPGTIAQVRLSAQEIITAAKKHGTTVLLVGHVTKEGTLAGPRVLEHMVDTVLYFEGERSHHFRILRAVKNRFGATDEIGVFEMCQLGLQEVSNPSALFLSSRSENTTGACVFAGMEGTRPMLLEIQALVAPSSLGTPRRASVGWDNSRLAMLIAVLETRADVGVGFNDVYLNVVGGLRISEPAADLAVAAALMSSLSEEPLPIDAVIFGEIGLSGEIRPISQTESRLKEAAKLGFKQAFLPHDPKNGSAHGTAHGLRLTFLKNVSDLKPFFGQLPHVKKRALP